MSGCVRTLISGAKCRAPPVQTSFTPSFPSRAPVRAAPPLLLRWSPPLFSSTGAGSNVGGVGGARWTHAFKNLSTARPHPPRVPRSLNKAAKAAFVFVCTAFVCKKAARAEYDRQMASIPDAGLPDQYDVDAISAFWQQHRFVTAFRSVEVFSHLAPFLWQLFRFLYLDYKLEDESGNNNIERERGKQGEKEYVFLLLNERLAKEIRPILESLGPAFIKFGQMMSIRPDLMPPEAIKELQKLCDAVAAVDAAVARATVEEQLRKAFLHPLGEEEVSSTVDVRERTSSLGEAHVRRSRDSSGREEQGERIVAEVMAAFDATGELVAAASLGQVYKVSVRGEILELAESVRGMKIVFPEDSGGADSGNEVVRTRTGNETFFPSRMNADGRVEVALKVQRPDMLRALSLDFFLIRKICSRIEDLKRYLMRTGRLSPRATCEVEVFDTFAAASFQELDYVQEASSQIFFGKYLVPKIGADKLKIPVVYRGLSTRKLLCMEFIWGEKLSSKPASTIQRICVVGVRTYMTQLLDLGLLHSDPHPGNLFVEDDTGKLVLLDFGLTARISGPDATSMTTAILHVMTNNIPALLDDLAKLNFLTRELIPATKEEEEFMPDEKKALYRNLIKDVEHVFREAKTYAQGSIEAGNLDSNWSAPILREFVRMKSRLGLEVDHVKSRLTTFGGQKARRKQLIAVSADLNRIFFEYPFTVPSYFALVTRALITLEGIALQGDENFDVFAAAYPYTQERAVHLFGAKNVAKIVLGAVQA